MPIRVCLLAAALLAASAGGSSAHRLKGVGPTSISVGFGSVWVGMGNGDVIRLDARSGRETARLRGGPTEFVHGVVAAYRAVWVLRGRVLRVDPRSNRTREVRRFGSATGFTIRAGSGALWIPDDGANEVVRIDPKRVRLAARIGVPGRAWGVAAGQRNGIVVSVPTAGPVTGPDGVRLLHRLDPKTNTLSAPLVRVHCDVGVAVATDAVWTFDSCNGVLSRRDSRTLQPRAETTVRAPWQTPELGFGSVWLASRGGVLRIDPTTLRTVAVIPARSLTLAIGAGFVWALDEPHSTIRKIDPRTNRVVGGPWLVATNPSRS